MEILSASNEPGDEGLTIRFDPEDMRTVLEVYSFNERYELRAEIERLEREAVDREREHKRQAGDMERRLEEAQRNINTLTNLGEAKRNQFIREIATERERAERLEAIIANFRKGDPDSDPTGSVVYFMDFGDTIKIGYSTNMKSRVAALKPKRVLGVVPGGRELEVGFHERFRLDRRGKTEHFFPSTGLLTFIEGVTAESPVWYCEKTRQVLMREPLRLAA